MHRFLARLTHCAVLSASAVALWLFVIGCERPPERPTSAATAWREFEGSWNAAGSRRTMALGAERQSSIIDLRGTMLLGGPGRPGVGFRADVIALADSATGLVGRGVWTDERGDTVFSELTGEGTKERNHLVGTIVGGTGRYVGATGTYQFSWHSVVEGDDGSISGRAVDVKGRVRLGGSTAGGAGSATP